MKKHASLSPNPSRLVLTGVPRVNFYEGGPRCPEDIILPSCLRAILEYLVETDYGCKHCLIQNPNCKIFCTYAFLVGVTGAAAYFSWKEGWQEDNPAIFYMSADPSAPESHAFAALGYACEWITKAEGSQEPTDRERFLQPILDSLHKGMPILAYGVIGPPESCLITGYDEGGEVLIGWNFFQNNPLFGQGLEFEPEGQFRKRDWLKDTLCLLIIGEKQDKPPFKEVYRQALQWMLQVTRTPLVRPEPEAPEWYRQRHNGLAAYAAWARHLLRDEDFSTNDEAILLQRHSVHESAVGAIAEARWYGSQFLIEAANPDFSHYGMAENLYHAAACYAGEHELMWKLWDLAGGNGNPAAFQKLADPAIRRQMVPVILAAQDKDDQAAHYIEQALTKWR